MCIDNPRVGFANIFDTHPSVDARVKALMQYAGGHDPGPLALEPPHTKDDEVVNEPPPGGPWGDVPQQPSQQGPWGTGPGPQGGPWGPSRS
jgi:heat shock protein HtpX